MCNVTLIILKWFLGTLLYICLCIRNVFDCLCASCIKVYLCFEFYKCFHVLRLLIKLLLNFTIVFSINYCYYITYNIILSGEYVAQQVQVG